MTKAQEIYERVESLVAQGVKKAEAVSLDQGAGKNAQNAARYAPGTA